MVGLLTCELICRFLKSGEIRRSDGRRYVHMPSASNVQTLTGVIQRRTIPHADHWDDTGSVTTIYAARSDRILQQSS